MRLNYLHLCMLTLLIFTGSMLSARAQGWSLTNNPAQGQNFTRMVAIDGFVNGETIIVGIKGSKAFKSVNGGNTFSEMNLSTSFTLSDIDIVSGISTYVAVGGNIAYRTTNGGSSWTANSLGAAGLVFNSVSFSGNTGWAVGDNGLIRKTTDGGITWAIQTSPVGSGNTLYKVKALNTLIAIAVGANGIIIRTQNGGTTWTLATNGTTTFRDIESQSGNILAVGSGGRVIRSTNDGINWSDLSSGTTQQLNDVTYGNDVAFIAGNNGTILGVTGSTVTARNSGRTDNILSITNRTYLSSSNTNAVNFAWASTVNGFITTSSAGLTCTAPVSLNTTPTSITICEGQPLNLSANFSGTVQNRVWKRNGVIVSLPESLNAHPTTLSYAAAFPSQSGVYTLEATSTCGTAVTAGITVTVNPLPAATSAITGATTPTQNVGATYSVTNVAGTSYTWAGGAGATITGSGNSVTITWTGTGARTVSVTPSNGCGVGSPTTLAVSVQASLPVSSLDPADNATNVALDANLRINFAQAVTTIAGKTITIRRASDNSVFETITLPSSQVTFPAATPANSALLINPNGTFQNGTGYYVNIEPGAIRAGLPPQPFYAGITNTADWNFTTVATGDVTPPTLVGLNPINGGTNVAVGTNLVATFSENIVLQNGKAIAIRRVSDNSVFASYTLPSANVTASGTVVTINPTTDLASNTNFYVTIENGAVQDLAGNSYTGIITSSGWNFTTQTVDITPPVIGSYVPTHSSSNVALDANLFAVFSESVTAVTGKIISVRRSSDNSVFESYTLPSANVGVSGTTITINPTNNLVSGTSYYVLMDAGAFKDLAGNDFAGIATNTVWSFTTLTVDTTPPTISILNPANNAANVAIDANLIATFSEAVTAVTSKTISIRRVSDNVVFESYTLPIANVTVSGSTVTINPTGNLLNGTDYHVIIDAGTFKDAAGNDFAGIANNTVWRFGTIKQNQTITFNALTARTFGDAQFSLSATASSGLPVSYTSSNTSVATVSGNTVTIVGAGSTNITASQVGNATYNAAANVQQTLTVNKANQTITFSPLPGKQLGDAAFGLTATASSGLAVTYTSSNTGVATVSGSTVTITGVGTTTITAAQAGNTNFNAAPSVNQTLMVTAAAPALAIQSLTPTDNAANVNVGTNLVLTFNQNINVGAGTISVRRVDNDAVVTSMSNFGGGISISGASITFDLPIDLPAGTDLYVNITAGYLRSAADASNTFVGISDKNTWNFSTTKQNQTITFDVLTPRSFGDAPFNLTATASSALPVSYTSSNTSVATVSGNTVTIVGAGTTTITASQAGNANFNAAANVQQTLTVNKANQTITFAALASRTFGDANFNLSATASSGLAISYSSSNTSVATISGNTVTIVGAGTTIITASQVGNTNFNAATPVQQTFTVNKADQTITFAVLTNKTFGDANFNLSATSSSGLAVSYSSSNTSVATVSGNTVTIIGSGTTTITATQGGNVNFNAATSVGRTFTVNKADQTITFGPIAAKSVGDPPFSLSATVSSGLTISYTSSNTSVATVSGNTVTIVGAGTTTITASQTGNTNFNAAANVQQTLTVNKANQTITFAALAAKTFGDAPFNLTATASSGLAVSYTSSNTSVATISGNTITIVGAGSTTITALQAGNTSFNAASNVAQTLTVNKANQTITFASLPGKQVGDASFALSATASSGLAVSYTSSNTTVATIIGSTVTIVAAGTTTITAAQVGNANYNAATAVQQTLTVTTAAPALAIQSLSPADNATNVNVGANLVLTFNQNVSVGAGTISVRRVDNDAVVTSMSNLGSGISISGATVTFDLPVDLPAGTDLYVNITAGYLRSAADASNTFASISNKTTWNFTTAKQNQTITFNALAAKTFGDAQFNLSATASSGLPVSYISSNPSVATISGNTVTIVGAGSTTITASQTGNATYNAAANVQQTLTVNKANQTISFAALATQTFGNAPFTLTATASSGLLVSYVSSNTSVATISGNTITVVGAGVANITASQAGNTNFNAATTVQQNLTVNKANQTITFTELPVKNVGDPTFTISATATSGLTVGFSSSNPTVATISGNTITILAAGSTTITATQVGNGNYNAAAAVSRTLVVNNPGKQNQTITFAALSSKTLGDATFTLNATASSGLAITYTSSNTSIATISGNTVTLVGAGSVTIHANQPGNATFNAAPQVSQSFCVNPAKPTITATDLNTATPVLKSSSATGNQWFRNNELITGATNETLNITEPGVYKVRVSAGSCISAFSDDFALIVTGDLPTDHIQVSVYPNPTADFIQISLPDDNQLRDVAIFNLQGQRLESHQTRYTNLQVDVQAYAPGNYVLHVVTGKQQQAIRFIKK